MQQCAVVTTSIDQHNNVHIEVDLFDSRVFAMDACQSRAVYAMDAGATVHEWNVYGGSYHLVVHSVVHILRVVSV